MQLLDVLRIYPGLHELQLVINPAEQVKQLGSQAAHNGTLLLKYPVMH